MPGYQRFVTYMFRYEDGKKQENCGFAKIEIRQEQCRIQIQIKKKQKSISEVYFLYGSPQEPMGIYIGELLENGESVGRVFQCESEHICNTTYSVRDMRGLYIKLAEDDNTFLASLWDDNATEWSKLQLLNADEMCTQQNRQISEELQVMQQEMKLTAEKNDAFSETEKSTEASSYLDREQFCPMISAWEKQWKRFIAAHPLFCPFDEDGAVYAVKLQMQDFKILPEKYQYLANNSFLLHGYFNYHMVLFGYMEAECRQWFLGVPGVFSNQEQLMAGIFGFPEFRTKQMTRQKTGEFGYWYRFINI